MVVNLPFVGLYHLARIRWYSEFLTLGVRQPLSAWLGAYFKERELPLVPLLPVHVGMTSGAADRAVLLGPVY